MKTLHPQLALAIGLPDHSLFESFHPGANVAAVRHLQAVAAGGVEPVLWLWGRAGVGKTHLLQAACAAAGRDGRQAVYLPLRELVAFDPEVLSGWEHCALVCIDDLDALPADADWEHGLFDLFNGLRDAGGSLVVAAAGNPRASHIALADLCSRLSSGPVFRLQPLDDTECLAALGLRSELRGLELPRETGRYLLRHYARDVRVLYELLDRLDTESLAAGRRRLTVPFVKSILANDPKIRGQFT